MWFLRANAFGIMTRHHLFKTHLKDVLSVSSEFQELGNLFEAEVKELMADGKFQYDTVVQKRLIDRSKPITDTIKKNNLPLVSISGKNTNPRKSIKYQR